MKISMPKFAVLVGLACWACALGGVSQAQIGLRMTRSRTYVMGYRVEPGGFVLPVTGIVTDGIIFQPVPFQPAPPEPPIVLSNRAVLDSFFAANPPNAQPQDNAGTPVRAPTVSGFFSGVVRLGEDRRLLLIVNTGNGQVAYALQPDGLARTLVEAPGDRTVRASVFGTVVAQTPLPILNVESGSLEFQ